MITQAKYTSTGTIHAVIDGQEMDIPIDEGNRHWQMIAEWETNGHAIEPYIAVPPPEPDPVSAVDKLAQFLNANPDVKALIE